MKSIIISIIPILCALTSQAATYQETIKADQPVGYWRLGDAAGATQATNSGSLGATGNGTPILNVTFGVPGAPIGDADTAANFDAAQSKIDVPFAPELNPTNFTIEAWARVLGGSTGYRSPVSSRDDSPQKGFIFYAEPGETWQFWTGTGQQVGWNIVTGPPVQDDVWDYLVGTYDGTNKLFYVNGVLVGANQSAFAPNGARVLRIGGGATESPVGDFFFNGDIDEVAVYNKALTPDRVITHFTQGSGNAPESDIAPTFAVQPVSLDRFKNESASLEAIAIGSPPLSYQWQKDGTNVPGATSSKLTLNNLQVGESGSYTVDVTNSAGNATSDPAVLTIADLTKPVITTQPRPHTVLPGSSAAFSVAATGSTLFDYQWQFKGADLLGATNATLTITNVQSANLGSYTVIVKNAAGSTTSDAALLQFPAVATKSYADTVKQDAPVAYWRLDESSGEVAKDSIDSNDGAYLNGVVLGEPGALVGDTNKAAGFITANQTKVDVPWSDALNPPVFTAEIWAKVTGNGTYRSPMTSRESAPQAGYIFYAEPGNTWQFWIGSSDPLGWAVVQGPPVQLGTYAHLVGVYDGTNSYFYVNGVLAGQTAAVLAPNSLNPLRIGGGSTEGDGDFFFQGDLDEAAIYNTALSEDRILAHYVAGFPLTTPPAITVQPVSQFALAGGTTTFSVTATGGLPLSYQWKFNNQNISNAILNTLVLTNVSAANAGSYSVVVTNTGGTVTSSVVTLGIPSRSTKAYVDLVKTDGAVAYWRLGEPVDDVDGIAKDEIGINDGTYLNGVTLGVPGAIPGDTNTAVNFSAAASQKMDVPWADTLNPPQFTVELWARVTGVTGNFRSPLTSRADSPQRGYIFYAEPGNTWQFWSGKGDTSGWDSIPGPAVHTNEWAYLAATYDGATKRFYVNGEQVGSSTAAFGVNDASPLRIGGGASEGDGNYFFQGDVDEAAVYDKALGADQIIVHYLGGANATAPGVSLSFARNANNVILTWPSGTLQSATTLSGTWAPVPGAQSPYSITLPTSDSARFYRLLAP